MRYCVLLLAVALSATCTGIAEAQAVRPTPTINPQQRVCQTSAWCQHYGYCSYAAGTCLALSDRDCSRSMSCRRYGRCRASAGRCVESRTQANDPAMAAAGGVITAVGALLVLVSAGIVAASDTDLMGQHGPHPALFPLVGGLGLVALGIPLVVVGSQQVPAQDQRAGLSLVLGPTAAGLAGSF